MPVTRIVLVKLTDEHCTDEGRAAAAAHTREVFSTLPGIEGFDVGVPADERARASWDMVIQVYFRSLDDVPAYVDHPDHRTYVDDFLSPRAATKKAWNFEV